MFTDCAKASKLLDDSSEFALTYEDKDGDWMLVGDVPWGYVVLSSLPQLLIVNKAQVTEWIYVDKHQMYRTWHCLSIHIFALKVQIIHLVNSLCINCLTSKQMNY